MRTVTFLAAAITLLGMGSAPSGGRPSLHLLARQPVTVGGLNFKPRERVRVALLEPDRGILRLRASGTGKFRARFAGVWVDRCSALGVQATGALGSRAALKLKPQCPPP